METTAQPLKLAGYVGFHNLPNQFHRKSIKQGFDFTLMVVGESGLGKSSLINSLFGTALYPAKQQQQLTTETPKTVEIQSVAAEFEENGVKLRLTCIDTPGFGDFVNNHDCWQPILDNIKARFDAYLDQESRVNRQKIVDTRVHACIYFIQPTGHSLKPIDIEFMKRLGDKVNLIPVIAKADTLTDQEIQDFKLKIMSDIETNQISIYKPETHENDDAQTAADNKEILSKIPFAVVGADTEITVNKEVIRGRQYPWGIINIENEDHCDFVALRKMLIRTNMEELKQYTNDELYENYRLIKISATASDVRAPVAHAPSTKLEQDRSAHDQKMQKMEMEMKAVFQQKVAEKEAKLKQSEDELYARHREMKDQLERQRQELDEKKRRLGGKKPKGLFK